MNRTELLNKLDGMIRQIEDAREWGSLELRFSGGVVNLILNTVSQQVPNGKGENSYAKNYR